MPVPQRPTALFVVNGWYLELPGLVSPHFQTLSGLSKKTGRTEIVDAGTNIKFKFNDQIIDFGEITLARTMDGSSDDPVFRALVDASIHFGIKHAGVLIKRHHGVPVFSIAFDGLKFETYEHPEYDVNSGNQLSIRTLASVDIWTPIP